MRLTLALWACLSCGAFAASSEQVAYWLHLRGETNAINAIGATAPLVVMLDGAIDYWPYSFSKPTDAELPSITISAQWFASQQYPSPDITVPMLATNGAQVGTARIVVDPMTMAVIAITNSASPQRDWATQQADYSTEATAQRQIAQELNLTASQIAAVKVWYTNSPAAVFPNMTAAQRNWLTVQWQMMRYFAKRDLRATR